MDTVAMGAAYRAVREMLDEAGWPDVAYSLDLEWWSHRRDEVPAPTAKIWVAWRDAADQNAGQHYGLDGRDFDCALAMLRDDLAGRPALAPKAPAPAPDMVVEF